MKANELRVGNFVFEDYWDGQNTCFRIIQIDRIDNNPDYCIGINPIELTPEVLEKCGFNIILGDWHVATHFINTDFTINNAKGEWRFTPIWCLDYKPIKYLHQLQNLYFALTGEELNFTP